MQHPDEGTIHAWLDGALSTDDARAFEAHVAECARCAAAVTEARGLLAASSRILSALDSVPGGVLPASEPEIEKNERVIPIGRSPIWRSPGWRAAAAIVLVGSVSWLATRSVGRQAEGNLASPTEAASVGAIGATPQPSARMQADSVATVGDHSAPPSAPRAAQPAARRPAGTNEQRSTASGAAANADRAVVPPAPEPQVAAAPQVIPYAMPKLAEAPNVGAVGGAVVRGTMTAQSAAARMKASAPAAASGALMRTEASPAPDPVAERLAGCYYIENAASQSTLPAIRSAAGLVPAQVELVPEPDVAAGGSWRILRPAPGAPPFRLAGRAAWLVLSADSVNLELGHGTQSVTARIGVKGDSIHGYATITAPLLPGGGMGTGMRGSRILCSTP